MIWDYAADLALTESQVEQLKVLFLQLKKNLAVCEKKLVATEIQIRALIAEEAPLDELKAKIRKAADHQVEGRIIDLQMSRKINAVLKSEQLEKWREIQARDRAQQPAMKQR